jgi:hypothetical protein
MCKPAITRALGVLIVMFAAPLVLPLAGKNKVAPVKTGTAAESPELAAILDRVIANENQFASKIKEFSPRVETYLQYYQLDSEVGDVANNDAIFLGRLQFDPKEKESAFSDDPSYSWTRFAAHVRKHLRPDYFALQSLGVDLAGFDRDRYVFEPVRWEYLGDLRCLALDVRPRNASTVGAFLGRIWVEDHNHAIVRLNGTRVHPPRLNFYVHFDCWRENLQPGLWLPVYIYSEESELGERLRYKAVTRLWGYDLTSRQQQQEWTSIQVEAPAPIRDNSDHGEDLSPVESKRRLSMDAERNVLDRLEKARLIAPPGPIDKVLETVVNNLKVTNHLDSLPPIQCRVMETSSLESFSLAYTIVVSRGLMDVLPDEASLAMVLAHEIGHIALGHKVDTKYAFNDRMIVTDEDLLASLDLARSPEDEGAADAKAVEFLKNSPYKDNLAQAGLFLRATAAAAPSLPHLFGAHLGNGLAEGDRKLVRMAALMSRAPELAPKNVSQIAALPLGSRVQVNAWDGAVAFTTRKGVALVDATEKLPFQVTPMTPYLRPYASAGKVEMSERKLGGDPAANTNP